MAKEILLTEQGYADLKQRLDYLETQKRQEVSERIKEAREYGDISENSEYDAAKNEQSMVEGEIEDIKQKLRLAKIIADADATPSNIVAVGKTVVIMNYKFNQEQTFMIVGTTEANAVQGKMSNESPIGKALIGKKVGDMIEVNAPAGALKVKILEIK